jgi:hypothetical protein
MKKCIEQNILLAIAVVTGVAPFGLSSTSEGLILAALNAALALCARLR